MTFKEEILKKVENNDVLWAWSADKGVYINKKEILDKIFAKYQEIDEKAKGLSSDENS